MFRARARLAAFGAEALAQRLQRSRVAARAAQQPRAARLQRPVQHRAGREGRVLPGRPAAVAGRRRKHAPRLDRLRGAPRPPVSAARRAGSARTLRAAPLARPGCTAGHSPQRARPAGDARQARHCPRAAPGCARPGAAPGAARPATAAAPHRRAAARARPARQPPPRRPPARAPAGPPGGRPCRCAPPAPPAPAAAPQQHARPGPNTTHATRCRAGGVWSPQMRAAAAGRAGARQRHLDGNGRRRDGGRRGRGQHLGGRRRARGLGLRGARLASRAARARGGRDPARTGQAGQAREAARSHWAQRLARTCARLTTHACTSTIAGPAGTGPWRASPARPRCGTPRTHASRHAQPCKQGHAEARLHGRVGLLLRRRLRGCTCARALRCRRLLQLPPLHAAGGR